MNKYPTVACDTLTSGKSYDDLEMSAIIEWTSLTSAEEQGQKVSYKGHVQCFCDQRYAEEKPNDLGYGEEDVKVCEDYI